MWTCSDCPATFPNQEAAIKHLDESNHTFVEGPPRRVMNQPMAYNVTRITTEK